MKSKIAKLHKMEERIHKAAERAEKHDEHVHRLIEAAEKHEDAMRKQHSDPKKPHGKARMKKAGKKAGKMLKKEVRAGKKEGKVEKVMKEFKEHKLHSGSKKGPEVRNPKQAIAIALSEARKAGEHVKPKRKKK